jgi:DNA-binding NarL/FixJ family response regulator
MRSDPAPESDIHSAAWEELSPEQLEVTRLVCKGLTDKQIGDRLHLSPRTVQGRLQRIFKALGTSSRTQLVAAVARGGPDAFDALFGVQESSHRGQTEANRE